MSGNLRRSIFGRAFGLSPELNLVSNGIEISSPAVQATITVSAEGATSANVRDIVITLKDANGVAIDYVETVDIIMYLDAAQAAFVVTGGSTGIADGGAGALSTVVAKKLFHAVSTSAGVIELDWTDTGTEAAYMGVRLPNGRTVMSDALTNA